MCVFLWIFLNFFFMLNFFFLDFFVKQKYRPATPTAAFAAAAAPPPPSRSGYPSLTMQRLDWRALVKLSPPNIGKLGK